MAPTFVQVSFHSDIYAILVAAMSNPAVHNWSMSVAGMCVNPMTAN
jgi:hypothetical protein